MNTMNIDIPENFAVEEAADFREKIYYLIEKGERHFVFDFNKCTFIDSTGLGVMVSIYKRLAERDGKMKLHSLNYQVKKVFELTRLNNVFDIE